MDVKGTITAVSNVLDSHNFDKGCSIPEEFAQARFLKKWERPDSSKHAERHIAAWHEWLESDQLLNWKVGKDRLLTPNWAKAKILLRRILTHFRLGPISFTNGSEFIATRGFNSIESKLSRSKWTCTYDNFDLWARTCYGHRALKMSVRKRFAKLLAIKCIDKKKFERYLYRKFKIYSDFPYRIFCFKLSMITEFTQGNRFSTVPKNNLVNRPICIESLANILTQRRIGQGIRTSLKDYGLDLDTVAERHRVLISKPKFATIDLKNASDRISLELVKYLLPKRIYNLIIASRSEMTLGPDDQYYIVHKVSSMGNGFTFELMSLILYCLSKTYSDDVSVFGDDIIVPNEFASSIIADLEAATFVVNREKSHVHDRYRESCGAHYLDGHGYIESYDFKWPNNIGEVITISNKLSRLALLYPSFRDLWVKVYRALPTALYAENPYKINGIWQRTEKPFDNPKLDSYVVNSCFQFRKDGIPLTRQARKIVLRFCQGLQLDPRNASMHIGFEWKGDGALPTVVDAGRSWAKILMYLASGRRCADAIRGKGVYKSFKVLTLNDGTTFRWSAIVSACSECGRGIK